MPSVLIKTWRRLRTAWRRMNWLRRTLYSSGIALVFLAALLLQSFWPLFGNNNYELSEQTLQLIGKVREDAARHLKPNDGQTAYEFSVPEQGGEAAEHTGRVADAYSASFGINPRDGISVVDSNTQVSVRLVPKFYTGHGKKAPDNQMVYPFGKNQLIYSLKYNGLKEDIVLPEYIKDELDYTFEMILPVGAEARLDEQGNIGIYTADSSLFGNMTYGSDEDRERVEKARDKAEKTNLIITIPAPVIKDAAGQEYTDRSKFSLGDKQQREEKAADNKLPDDMPEEVRNRLAAKSTVNAYSLTISSTRLNELTYPISIDPTFQVTSAADFRNTDLGPGVEIDSTNNLIQRGSMTGGTVAGWGSTTNTPTNIALSGTAAYNGRIYLVGGDRDSGGQYTATVTYATVNSNGTLSSWNTTSSLNTGRRYHGVIAHNGYIYAIGGQSPTSLTSVEYAKINANGTLGAWQSTVSLPVYRMGFGIEAYNGYLYAIAGNAGGAVTNTVIYARLNANGSIASDSGCGNSWCSTTNTSSNRLWPAAAAYNGWLYVVGGNGGAGGLPNPSLIRAPINSDGTLGSWINSSEANTPRSVTAVEIWNGYLYMMGGCSAGVPGFSCPGDVHLNTVEYAPIHADGSLGTWRTTASFTTARIMHGSAVWNGYLYVLGGCTVGSYCNFTNSVQYTSINPAGSLADGSWSSGTNLPASYSFGVSTIYNGCLYHVGGWSGTVGYLDVVRYATISNNGSIGSWTTSGNTMSVGRRSHSITIYNGRLYVSGGQIGAGPTMTDIIEYADINSDCSISAFTTTTLSLPAALMWDSFVIYNDWAYSIGGDVGSTNNTRWASVDASTGDITGSWSTSTTVNINQHRAVVHSGFMYLVGGMINNSLNTVIRYAPIQSDGSISGDSWVTGTSYLYPRRSFSSFMYNGYLYMAGGNDESSPTLSMEMAPVLSDGSVGTWQEAGDIDQARGHSNQAGYVFGGAAAHNGYIYLAGGYTGSNHTNSVVYKALNNGGQGGPATFAAGTTFTTARKFHASVAYNGYIYVLGGCTTSTLCTTATNTVRYAPLNVGGSIGSWSNATTNFTTARRDLYAFAYNGRMYVVSGREADGNTLYDIQYATIQTNGNINTSWTTDGTSFPSTGYAPGVALNGNVLYVLGGASSSTTTYYSVVDDSTGDVGSFTSTTSLPEGRYRAWTVIYKGYIYAIGGNSSGGWLRSVWYAPLNNDHTIGTWRLASTQLNGAIGYASATSAFTLNGFLYIAGGADVSGRIPYVQYAAISAGGDLGAWQLGITSGLTNHGNYAAVEYSGTMYITGGQITGTDPVTNTRYATLQSIPRVGSFNRVYDFDSGVKPEKLVTRGTEPTGAMTGLSYLSNVSCDNSLYGDENTSPDIELGGTGIINIGIGSSTLVRCLLLKYTLDDRYSAVFPDTGNETQITDFDLYFIANPGSRLRGGRTFTNGVDKGLSASPSSLEASLLTYDTSQADSTSYVTSSVSPGAEKVLLLAVSSSILNETNPPAPSSISGLGMTWTLVESMIGGGGATVRRVSLYRAQTGSSAPTPGTITINFPITQEVAGWALAEFSNAKLGNNGADAIGVADTDETSGATLNFDLGASVPGSVTMVFAASNNNISQFISSSATEMFQETTLNAPVLKWTGWYSPIGESNIILDTSGNPTRKVGVGVRILPGN